MGRKIKKSAKRNTVSKMSVQVKRTLTSPDEQSAIKKINQGDKVDEVSDNVVMIDIEHAEQSLSQSPVKQDGPHNTVINVDDGSGGMACNAVGF
jgi:hypothetical protein